MRTLAIAFLAAVVTAIGLSGSSVVDSAHAGPSATPGLDFSIGIDTNADGTDDCSTQGATTTTCRLPLNSAFSLNVYLKSLPDGVVEYGGFDIVIGYFGVTSQDDANFGPWSDCRIPASFFTPTWFAIGCAIGPLPNRPSTHIGNIARAAFNCAASGSVSLSNGNGRTDLAATVEDPFWGPSERTYHELSGIETVTIECGDPPVPPPPPDVHGDANCDGAIDSRDAAIVLQFDARLLHSVPCPRNADVGKGGMVNAIDAYVILQFSAGLISTMPAPYWLPPPEPLV